jgi:serpin B
MRRYLTITIAALLIAACSSSPGPGSSSGSNAPAQTTAPSAAAQLAELTEYRSTVARDTASASSDQQMRQVVAADSAFAFNLYHELANGSQSDVFLSPYSISTALSMVLAGARGTTADQMSQVMGVSDSAEWHPARNLLAARLVEQLPAGIDGTAQPMTLDTTNAIFGQSGYPFEQPFLDLLARDYGAGLEAVDFANQPDNARVAINTWVAQQTADRIRELLAQGSVDELTRAVLVNTIYFKANWMNQFDPKATTNNDFHLLNGSVVSVPTMRLNFGLDYAAGDGWAAVSLPYWGASMTIIVPDAGKFAQIEKSINPTFLANLDSSLSEYGLALSVPKWSADDTTDLVPPLQALGITDLFHYPPADLSGIETIEPLYISDATHKANISVDEQGTEAAAATALVAEATAGNGKTATLTVDRPFIYLIRDQNTNEIVFMGRVMDPS